MRKSIDSLSIVAADGLEVNPMLGQLFIFYNKYGDKIKILYWDKNGFCLWYKRLEKGKFKLPGKNKAYELSVEQLRWLLDGLDISSLSPIKELNYTMVC